MKKLFALRGALSTRAQLILGILGGLLVLLAWYVLTMGEDPIANTNVFPPPSEVFGAFGQLYQENDLIRNLTLSLGLNVAGYMEAVLISIPLGFAIGLVPLFRGLLQRIVDAVRYIPLTAVTGIFIAAYGLGTEMKVHFLAFGILIYLLPVVVQRIDEVQSVYLKTVHTLGATDWQTIKTVYFPAVMARLSDDIRVLTAISWTYIIIAESLGNQGGIGGLIWRVGARQGRIDKVFALLLIIIIIGVVQDKIFTWLDREYFGHKFQTKNKYAMPDNSDGVIELVWKFIRSIGVYVGIVIYLMTLLTELGVLGDGRGILSYYFGDSAWVIHFIAWCVILAKGYGMWRKHQYPYLYNSNISISKA